ncbi:MAG: hypothetical protein B6I19_01640 [Bacteroidetes bacterium 4572_114]|nr:MAG: hypothetical protein B6I19_01640 [Bacteroidetes bacterium 4572_114]
MNTFTIEQIRQNADLLFSDLGNEPVLLKKGSNQMVSFKEFDEKWGGFMQDVQLADNWRDDYIYDKIEKYQ